MGVGLGYCSDKSINDFRSERQDADDILIIVE
jgi:hypothetical protein